MEKTELESLLKTEKAAGGDPLDRHLSTTTFILKGIGDGSIECDDATKQHYVEKARTLVEAAETRKARHAIRDLDSGKFRPIHDGENIMQKTEFGAVKHRLNGMHPALRALLTGNPRDAIT